MGDFENADDRGDVASVVHTGEYPELGVRPGAEDRSPLVGQQLPRRPVHRRRQRRRIRAALVDAILLGFSPDSSGAADPFELPFSPHQRMTRDRITIENKERGRE